MSIFQRLDRAVERAADVLVRMQRRAKTRADFDRYFAWRPRVIKAVAVRGECQYGLASDLVGRTIREKVPFRGYAGSLLAVVVCLLAGCGISPAPVPLVPPPPVAAGAHALLVVGDSYARLGDWSTWFPGAVNEGEGGDRVDQVAARIHSMPAAPRAWLWCGINDLIQHQDRGATLRAYGECIDQLRARGAVVTCISPLPLAVAFDPTYSADITPQDVAVLDAEEAVVAAAHGARWVDVRPAVVDAAGFTADAYSLPAGIHLNAAGYSAVVPVLMAVPQ